MEYLRKAMYLKFTKRKSSPKGITLIEILIGVAISSIVMLAFLSLYIIGQKYIFNQNARADSIEDSRYPLAWISRDIKESFQVSLSSVSGIYTTSADTLVLQVPSVDASGLIIDIDSNYDYIIYRQNPTIPYRLERIIEADAVSSRQSRERFLADDLDLSAGETPVEFIYYDLSGIKIEDGIYTNTLSINVSLVSRKNGVGRAFQERINTRVKLRNKTIS